MAAALAEEEGIVIIIRRVVGWAALGCLVWYGLCPYLKAYENLHDYDLEHVTFHEWWVAAQAWAAESPQVAFCSAVAVLALIAEYLIIRGVEARRTNRVTGLAARRAEPRS